MLMIRDMAWKYKSCIHFSMALLVLVYINTITQNKLRYNIDEEVEIDVYDEDRTLNMAAMEKRMSQRRQRVKEVCQRYNFSREIPYKALEVYRSVKVVRCPVFKAGSTSWKYNLCILNGKTREEISAGDSRRLAEYDCDEETLTQANYSLASTSLKILTVRHPFLRLLSAYRDKLENRTSDSESYNDILDIYYKTFSLKIIYGFRPYSDSLHEPTFQEFIQYLLHGEFQFSDLHWIPFYIHCNPCAVEYDVIAKTETLHEDMLYVLKKIGKDKLVSPKKLHVSKRASTYSKVWDYYSTLKKLQVVKLFEALKMDFELFGYSPHEYIEAAS